MPYTVLLTSTPCALGGVRPWFVCAGSKCGGRRARFLYLRAGCFFCRVCQELTYASRQAHRNSGEEFALICRRQERIEGRMKRARSRAKINKLRNEIERLDGRSRGLMARYMPDFLP